MLVLNGTGDEYKYQNDHDVDGVWWELHAIWKPGKVQMKLGQDQRYRVLAGV